MHSSRRETLILAGMVTGLLFSGQAAYAFSGAAPERQTEFKIGQEWKGSQCGYIEPAQIVLRSKDQWMEVWSKVHNRQLPTPALPQINFERKMVIAVFMGEQRSGGYRIGVKSITQEEGEIIVEIEETKPAPDSVRIMALTQPYYIGAVDSSPLPVRFH